MVQASVVWWEVLPNVPFKNCSRKNKNYSRATKNGKFLTSFHEARQRSSYQVGEKSKTSKQTAKKDKTNKTKLKPKSSYHCYLVTFPSTRFHASELRAAVDPVRGMRLPWGLWSAWCAGLMTGKGSELSWHLRPSKKMSHCFNGEHFLWQKNNLFTDRQSPVPQGN